MKTWKRTLSHSCALAITILLACTASAQVYKWVDANGNTQYGDAPPPTVRAKTVKIQNVAGVAAIPNVAPSSTANEAAQAATPKPPAIDPALAKANCKKARENQQMANDSGGGTKLDDKGKERDLSASEEKSERDRINKEVQYWCGLAGK